MRLAASTCINYTIKGPPSYRQPQVQSEVILHSTLVSAATLTPPSASLSTEGLGGPAALFPPRMRNSRCLAGQTFIKGVQPQIDHKNRVVDTISAAVSAGPPARAWGSAGACVPWGARGVTCSERERSSPRVRRPRCPLPPLGARSENFSWDE